MTPAAAVLACLLAGALASRELLSGEQYTTCACTRQYDPVCGGGKTYNNPCLAACAGLRYVFAGACTPGTPTAVTPPLVSECACAPEDKPVCAETADKKWQTFSSACMAGCSKAKVLTNGECPECKGFCTADYRPVCGEDGVTYGNQCAADCKPMRVVSQGECPPKPSPSPAPACKCTREFMPVCGKDGKTYSNKCLADCAKVTVASEGECGVATLPAITPPAGVCACTMEYVPVCGKDGKTYGNKCDAACAKTEVASQGECAKPTPQTALPPQAECICTMDWRPVCGKDGKTYGNKCGADCARVEIASQGECKAEASATPPPALPPKDECICTMEWRPVCGKDGQTYGNQCGAECARVEVASQGECPKGGNPAANPPAGTVVPDCICTADYNPVCGKDGKTYSNGCMATCAGQEVAAKGECAKTTSATPPSTPLPACICTREYMPVCGKDGKTYGNKCTAACANVAIAAQGECKPAAEAKPPACACNKMLAPVCGSNGKTYDNACLAKCANATVVSERACVKRKPGCTCSKLDTPVCSEDGFNYPSGCEAGCWGVENYNPGTCPVRMCKCTAEMKPVCGIDFKTYKNSCTAECSAGIKIAHAGPCQAKVCKCTKELKPVCGTNNKTYTNQCLATCAGVKVKSEGKCPPACACPFILAPVCGVNGKTFSNDCIAACEGVAVKSKGECPTA